MSRVTFQKDRPVDYLVQVAASDIGRAYKAVALRELAVEQGQTVVDLGCGPGTDLPSFAAATGPAGTVIGIDSDPEAIGSVRGLTDASPWIEGRLRDIHSLGLPDRSVDRIHTDRVLMHVPDPRHVVAEARRVLRADGRAVFAEPDFDTLVIDVPLRDTLRVYRNFISERVVRNAHVGRQLAVIAEDSGFASTRTLPVTAVFRDAREADRIFGFERVTRHAVEAGFLEPDEADRWLDQLATEPFFASATIFVVVAEV